MTSAEIADSLSRPCATTITTAQLDRMDSALDRLELASIVAGADLNLGEGGLFGLYSLIAGCVEELREIMQSLEANRAIQ